MTAVVILNYNGSTMLRRFLPSMVGNSGADAEVWVVDNASSDDSLAFIAREFPMVRIVALDRNYGFAEGYDRALQQIEADYYVLLNNDVEVCAGWLHPLTSFLDSHPDVAAVQPKLLKGDFQGKGVTPARFEYAGAAGGFLDRYGYPYCRGRIFSTVENDNGQYDEPMEIHWATGACLAIRASAYHASGGLDRRFFAHSEEIDLCWRLRIMGWKIYCVSQSAVYHLGGATLPQSPRKTYLNFRNNLTMLYKNLPARRLTTVLLIRCLLDYVAAAQMALIGHFADAKAVIRARRDFIRWKNDFSSDRQRIQAARQLPPASDVAPLSILWQYHALRRRKYSKLK